MNLRFVRQFLPIVVLGWIGVLSPAHLLAAARLVPQAGENQEGKQQGTGANKIVSLDGAWQVSIDDQQTWRPIKVPGTIEDQVDLSFDGVSWYRRTFDPSSVVPIDQLSMLDRHTVWLRFEAVATQATVWVNDRQVGEHLGGWTPFEFDISPIVRDSQGAPIEIRVRCDERVGHNTQGFLPIIAPHFSGIWKPVSVIRTKDRQGWNVARLDESKFLLIPDGEAKRVLIRGQVVGGSAGLQAQLTIAGLNSNSVTFEMSQASEASKGIEEKQGRPGTRHCVIDDEGHFELAVPVDRPRRWSPQLPAWHDVQIEFTGAHEGESFCHRFHRRVSFRSVEVDGERLLLNGQPVQVRGLLNWGLPPAPFPLVEGNENHDANDGVGVRPGHWIVAPTLDESVMKREIEFAKSRGFNLMKFCLWIPPQRYLDLCDEMGMLAWIEYPTWHPDFSPQRLAELKVEFDEFFLYVRDHPSVILHSLTCETGPGADLEVIRSLYEQCKHRIPGAVVEDDSSWIQWNRIHDFYDDHPYGNNHTWVSTLDRLKEYIAKRGVSKPLILGEAISADTWVEPAELIASVGPLADKPFPYPAPDFLAFNVQWKRRIEGLYGESAVRNLKQDSLRYARRMRKYQIETYRREVPFGGYVVSVIRDFRKASMGWLDYRDQPKWTARDWAWHGDSSLLLRTEQDRRSFYGDDSAQFEFLLSHFSDSPSGEARLVVELRGPVDVDDPDDQSEGALVGTWSAAPTSLANGLQTLSTVQTKLPRVVRPTRYRLTARLSAGDLQCSNHWPIWIVPHRALTDSREVFVSEGFDPTRIDINDERIGRLSNLAARGFESPSERPWLVVANRLDKTVWDAWQEGDVLLLPNNQPGSFPTTDHWFLRGGPVIPDPGCKTIPRAMLVELQHFDLAGPVVPNLDYLDQIEPIILLWDNHDRQEVRTHGVAFRIRSPKGHSLLVATPNFRSPAGQYLLSEWIRDSRRSRPERIARDSFLEGLKEEIRDRKIELHRREWKFQPERRMEPTPSGMERGWAQAAFDDSAWPTIRIDRHWEGQGDGQPWNALDGWAWYRTTVPIPKDWPNESTWLNFTGVDDYFILFVNGKRIGTGGDLENRKTAFDLRASFDISRQVQPGEALQISIAVYDWYGAGGIFRPVSLTRHPLSQRPRVLK